MDRHDPTLDLLAEKEIPSLPPLPPSTSPDAHYFGQLLEWQTRVFVSELRRHETNDGRRHDHEMKVLGGIRNQISAIDADRDATDAAMREDKRAFRDKLLTASIRGTKAAWTAVKQPIVNAFTILVVGWATYYALHHFKVTPAFVTALVEAAEPDKPNGAPP